MFASFLLPSVFEGEPARHLQVFYNQLAGFGRHDISFIAQPDYFRPPASFEAEGRPEWRDAVREMFQFEPPQTLQDVVFETLPEDLFTRRVTMLGSSWKLYGQLMRRRVPELEAAFGAALDRLGRRRSLEGVITFVDMPSVARASAERNLPLVHCEYGPLRAPGYVMTGYWDIRRTSVLADAGLRLRAFTRAVRQRRITLLDRPDLLRLLRRDVIPDMPDAADAPYRVGIALQGDEVGYGQGISQLDLHSVARRHVGYDEVLIRHHPAARTYCSELLGLSDRSPNVTDFIARCETILTVSSGTALEALLFGRRAVVVGDSAFALAADRALETRAGRSEIERLTALNFLALNYIVPFELMLDADYSRWRLSGPPEHEISEAHRRWYQSWADRRAIPASLAGALVGAVPRTYRPEVLVFGAGSRATDIIARLRATAMEPTGLFDNDSSRWGAAVGSLRVESPAYRDRAVVVVSSVSYGHEMVNQLRTLGYPSNRIICLTQTAA